MNSGFDDGEPEQLELFRNYRREHLQRLVEVFSDPVAMAPLNRLWAYQDQLDRQKAKRKKSTPPNRDVGGGTGDQAPDERRPAA